MEFSDLTSTQVRIITGLVRHLFSIPSNPLFSSFFSSLAILHTERQWPLPLHCTLWLSSDITRHKRASRLSFINAPAAACDYGTCNLKEKSPPKSDLSHTAKLTYFRERERERDINLESKLTFWTNWLTRPIAGSCGRTMNNQ